MPPDFTPYFGSRDLWFGSRWARKRHGESFEFLFPRGGGKVVAKAAHWHGRNQKILVFFDVICGGRGRGSAEIFIMSSRSSDQTADVDEDKL